MHPRLIHRRSISAQLLDVTSASTVVSTSFLDISPSGTITFISNASSPTTFNTGPVGEPTSVAPSLPLFTANPSTPVTTVTISTSLSPLSTSFVLPSISQPSSLLATPLSPTSLATSTVYQSTETITMTTQLPQRNQSPLSSSTGPSLALTSRDGIIILSLSVVAGILSILCGLIIWRRCRRRDQEEALENLVDPISFHQSGGRIESPTLPRVMDLNLETLSPLEFRSRARDRDSPIHSHDSLPSTAFTPTMAHNNLRMSPAPDVFDSRWPGRLVPLVPQRSSSPALNGTQVVAVPGENGPGSAQNGLDARSQTASTTTSNLHLARLDSGNTSNGPTPLVSMDAVREKRALERLIRDQEPVSGGGTWDEPPPESEEAEGMKDGPPAYSPGSTSLTHTIPPLPSDSVRPLPEPPGSGGGGGGWRSSPRRSSTSRISQH